MFSDISTKLKSKAELSDEQVETIINWLKENESKRIDFFLKFHEKIETKIDNGIFKHNEEESVQAWAWSQIKSWMKEMEEE